MGTTALKQHQVEGFQWLVNAWRTGWPGVLLADDMGLGKTYQALAFLALAEEQCVEGRTRSGAQGTALSCRGADCVVKELGKRVLAIGSPSLDWEAGSTLMARRSAI